MRRLGHIFGKFAARVSRLSLSTAAVLALAFVALLSSSCDLTVHKYPEGGRRFPVTIDLVYNTDLPLYTTVEFETKTKTKNNTKNVAETEGDESKAENRMPASDIRYVIEVYPPGATRVSGSRAVNRWVYTVDESEGLDRSFTIEIEEGDWEFFVWTDYVDQGSLADRFYNTGAFGEITLMGAHAGSNDYRDAFRGRASYIVIPEKDPDRHVEIQMERPLAKYEFITDDLDDFITKVIEAKAAAAAKAAADAAANGSSQTKDGDTKDGETKDADTKDTDTKDTDTKGVNIGEYRIQFNYTGYMPCTYNMFNFKPIDSSVGVKFSSPIIQISENEARLGFDYVFVNGTEGSVDVEVEVYDDISGELMAKSGRVVVPLMRSQLTIIRGSFLTRVANGGVGISPGFDGDFNIPFSY